MSCRTATIQRNGGAGHSAAALASSVVVVGGSNHPVSSISTPRRRYPQPDRCGAQFSSCCGPKTCRLCCQCCPPAKESTSTKILYCLTLLIGAGLMAVMLIPEIQRNLQKIFRDFNATCIDLNIGQNCMKLTGYMAAYKISFSVTFFFLSMGFLTLGVTSSKGVRAYIHNGFWFFKIMAIVTVIVATFVIPISHLNKLHSGWIYTTQIGNCLFMALQTLCLIDISGGICKALDKLASCSRLWRLFEASLAITILSLWLTMAIVIFISHGRQEYCITKHLVILFNTGFCIIMVLTAITPCARGPGVGRPASYGGRLLQAGLMAVYVTYWIWSAMQSTPETPGFIEIATRLMEKEDNITCRHYNSRLAEDGLLCASAVMMLITVGYVVSDFSGVKARVFGAGVANLANDTPMLTSSMVNEESEPKFCVCLQGSQPRSGSDGSNDDYYTCNETQPMTGSRSIATEMDGGQHVVRNELIHTTYSYTFLHWTLALATMFMTTQLTRWFQPREYNVVDFDKSWAIVAVKVLAGWTCGLVYFLYLLLPDRCCGRDNGTDRDLRFSSPLPPPPVTSADHHCMGSCTCFGNCTCTTCPAFSGLKQRFLMWRRQHQPPDATVDLTCHLQQRTTPSTDTNTIMTTAEGSVLNAHRSTSESYLHYELQYNAVAVATTPSGDGTKMIMVPPPRKPPAPPVAPFTYSSHMASSYMWSLKGTALVVYSSTFLDKFLNQVDKIKKKTFRIQCPLNRTMF